MIRKAFLMHVNSDAHDEYKRRHDELPGQLAKVLKEHGVSNYSIFLDDKRNLLFGYAEIVSEDEWTAIADTEECKKWWAAMSDVMATNDDNSPVSKDLIEIFHLA